MSIEKKMPLESEAGLLSGSCDFSMDHHGAQHVAIIMDGNNRWAKQRQLPSVEGHRVGSQALKKTVKACVEFKVKVLTAFAFSSENWGRPEAEVSALMELFVQAIEEEVPELIVQGVCLQFVGDLSRFPALLREKMQQAMQKTQQNDTLFLNVAVNYGGRWDIVNAARLAMLSLMEEGAVPPKEDIERWEAVIDERLFNRYTALSQLPPVDMMIRTGGEFRISNFLLWQVAYAELFFDDVLWPDFDKTNLLAALNSFKQRQRRFGRTGDQVS